MALRLAPSSEASSAGGVIFTLCGRSNGGSVSEFVLRCKSLPWPLRRDPTIERSERGGLEKSFIQGELENLDMAVYTHI